MSHAHTLSLTLLLSGVIASSAQAEGDAKHGKTLFARCAPCHAVTTTAQSKPGPNLVGVFGRQAGTASGFHYSRAMVGYVKVWDDQTLDSFLTAPTKAVPGTTMVVAVPNASDRADIIAYLKTISVE